MEGIKLKSEMVGDFVEVDLGDHQFAAWLRSQDKNWKYESFEKPPGTFYIAHNKIVAVVFYNNAKSTHRIWMKKEYAGPLALNALKIEADESCKSRGHVMGWDTPYRYETYSTQVGHCVRCGKEVILNTKPAPNEIDIGGEAVALNCGD